MITYFFNGRSLTKLKINDDKHLSLNKRAAHELIEFVINYTENIRERPVLPSVEAGYLRPLLPDKAPYQREPWAKIMPDIEKYIMPGVSFNFT